MFNSVNAGPTRWAGPFGDRRAEDDRLSFMAAAGFADSFEVEESILIVASDALTRGE